MSKTGKCTPKGRRIMTDLRPYHHSTRIQKSQFRTYISERSIQNCQFRTLERKKIQKVSPSGILSLQICQKDFSFERFDLGKNSYQFDSISQMDFRIRLIESKNLSMKSIFLVKRDLA